MVPRHRDDRRQRLVIHPERLRRNQDLGLEPQPGGVATEDDRVGPPPEHQAAVSDRGLICHFGFVRGIDTGVVAKRPGVEILGCDPLVDVGAPELVDHA